MAGRRFPVRVFLFALFCGTVIFWAINVRDWTNIDNFQPAGKFEAVPNYVEDLDGRAGRRRALFKLKGDGLKSSEARREPKVKNNYSADRHPWMFPRPLSELEKKLVPNQVFFVWCQNRKFTFNDYLSVLSVWKLLEPDKLEIHCDANVTTDNYNQWYQELNSTIPAFHVKVVERKLSICLNPIQYALEVLMDRGGIYMEFSTVLLRPLHSFRNQGFSISFNKLGNLSFIVSQSASSEIRRILKRDGLDQDQIVSMLKKSARSAVSCPFVSASLPLALLATPTRTNMCITLSSAFVLTPLDLHQVDNQDLTILRDLFYIDQRKEAECWNADRKKTAIPFLVHYVWFGSSEFSFRMYLSFLSTLHVARAERVFIHCNRRLTGPYWKLVSSHPKVTVVYREVPRTIYGHQVLYTQHFSDVVRADVLEKYGGIYLDWDVLWLQSPARLLTLGHEAIVDLDHMPRPDFPEVLNLGVFLAQPRSRFVRLWRWELRNYRSRDFFYNALELPFKVYERHPDTLFIEQRLQVMCFWLKCHPIFHPDHKNWNEDQPFNWRSDVYSIHFTHPDPEEYNSISHLLNSTGTFAQIGKFILDASGELG